MMCNGSYGASRDACAGGMSCIISRTMPGTMHEARSDREGDHEARKEADFIFIFITPPPDRKPIAELVSSKVLIWKKAGALSTPIRSWPLPEMTGDDYEIACVLSAKINHFYMAQYVGHLLQGERCAAPQPPTWRH